MKTGLLDCDISRLSAGDSGGVVIGGVRPIRREGSRDYSSRNRNAGESLPSDET